MKTIKTLTITGVAASLLSLLPSEALAVSGTVYENANYRTAPGGEFTLADTPWGLSGYSDDPTRTRNVIQANSFQTFCIERNENISNGLVVDAFRNPAGAIAGGLGGGNPDPISQGTAYLYSQFAMGTLSGYDYTPGAGRKASALALQEAIWYLENERSYAGAAAGHVLLEAARVALGLATVGDLQLNNGTNFFAGVVAVNLYSTDANGVRIRKQDLLYFDGRLRVPDGGASVMLLGLALAGLGSFKRFSGKKG